LAELLPSIGAYLGVPGAEDSLGLYHANKYIVLLVDGLGSLDLAKYQEHTAFLERLTQVGGRITAAVPSTTATSTTSIGAGVPPGAHGVAGYSFRYRGKLLNALKFPHDVSGLDLQPRLTYVERIRDAGVRFSLISQRRFEKSGLTVSALRGGKYLGLDDEPEVGRQVELALDEARGEEDAVIYLYEGRLDKAGHRFGVGSDEWLAALEFADMLGQIIFMELPPDTSFIIIADHGMVNVPEAHRLTVEDHPELLRDVELVAGEARFRHVYTEPGAAPRVARRWQRLLGSTAEVLTREEAVAVGWFGPMDPRVADHFGDVLVASTADFAVLTRQSPKEYKLVGMHGSLTAAEMYVPLLSSTNN
jgi:hypothetical protein